MSDQSDQSAIATEQLLELLMHLKKATPEAAKAILNSQPQIAYALITLMVNMNAISVEVFQKTLAAFGAENAEPLGSSLQTGNSLAQPTPAPAIPSHMQTQYRTSTPPSLVHSTSTPPHTYPNGSGAPQGRPSQPPPPFVATSMQAGYGNYLPSPGTPTAPPTQPAGAPPSITDTIAAMPEEQRAMIMRVITMTPEQINMLNPTDRANIIQLRATLGISS